MCGCCGENAVRMTWQTQRFNYLDGDSTVELEARVPVWSCQECKDQYTDEDAENIRHEAVCKYLGRLTPNDIRKIREGYGMSQAEFAETTRLGIASIKRWESGSLIQGASQDAYLRLLRYPSNLAIVRGITIELTSVSKFRPRTPISIEAKAAARGFQLRKRA